MRILTGREAIREALEEEMRRDESVFLIGEDITEYGGCFGVTGDMYKEFGKERIVNTPIAETGIINASVGAAMMGMRPVCEIMFMDFITLAADGLVNQAAKMSYMFGGQCNVPLVCRTPAGDRGVGGQHAQCLEAWFCHIPGLIVVMPSTPYDLKGLLKTSIRSNNPVVFVEHKSGYGMKGHVPSEEYTIPFGKGDIKREGKDVTVVATSFMVYKALEAAKSLAENEGIDVEVIDPRTLVPLDIEMIIKSVCKTKRLVIVYEAFERCGIGSDIAAQVIDSEAFYYLEAPIKRVAGLNVTMPYSPALTKAVTPDSEKIIKAVKEVLK
jgi:pyruvate/2-oxoglutarate/acetoin dehydrogenase E1 component